MADTTGTIKYPSTVHNSVYVIDQDGYAAGLRHSENRLNNANYVWNTDTLAWEAMQQPTISTDVLNVSIANPLPVSGPLTDTELRNSDVKVTLDSESVAVTGTFYPETQPISASALPLPSGAATSAKQDSSLTLQATLESLVDTLQELAHRLAPLGGSISIVGGQALRVSYGGGTFAVSGPQTSANFIATYNVAGVNYDTRVALHNMAAQANINNVTAA